MRPLPAPCLHGGYLGPIYWAVAHGMPAGVSALIVGLQPLMTAFLAAAIVGEKITSRHWFGLAVGILGVGLVVWPKLTLDAVSGITPLTTALCIFGALQCFARHGLPEALCHGTASGQRRRVAICGGFGCRFHRCGAEREFWFRWQLRGMAGTGLVGDCPVACRHHAADAAHPPWRCVAGFRLDLSGSRRGGADPPMWSLAKRWCPCKFLAWRCARVPCSSSPAEG